MNNDILVAFKVDAAQLATANTLAQQLGNDVGEGKTFGAHCGYNATGKKTDAITHYIVRLPVDVDTFNQAAGIHVEGIKMLPGASYEEAAGGLKSAIEADDVLTEEEAAVEPEA